MKLTHLFIAILILFGLCACNSAVPTPTVTTLSLQPTFTRPSLTPTSMPISVTPSPLPTEPLIPIITPDAIQVQKWKEYQTALGNTILGDGAPAICEWEILGQAEQKLYVWAVCENLQSGASSPAVIHLRSDETIQSVEYLKSWSKAKLDKLFPANVQALFSLYPYSSGRAAKMLARLKWRQAYPDIPPLIIISASTPEPTPTEWLPYSPNPTNQGCDEKFMATLPFKGTEGLSHEEIARKLFEISLQHFKSPELGGICRLEGFKLEIVKHDQRVDFLAREQKVDFIDRVVYSVQIQEVPSDWVAGNGESAPDGWIIHKSEIIGVTKVNDQYVLKLIGTGP